VVFVLDEAKNYTTMDTPVPQIFLHRPVKEFEDEADKALNNDRTSRSDLNSYRLATSFPGFRLGTEDDVVLVSALYKIRPCLKILRVLYLGQWHIYAEWSEQVNEYLQDIGKEMIPVERSKAKPSAKGKSTAPASSSSMRFDLIIKT
jgi:hypothetical protein